MFSINQNRSNWNNQEIQNNNLKIQKQLYYHKEKIQKKVLKKTQEKSLHFQLIFRFTQLLVF